MPSYSLAVESYVRLALWQVDLAQQQFAECIMVMHNVTIVVLRTAVTSTTKVAEASCSCNAQVHRDVSPCYCLQHIISMGPT